MATRQRTGAPGGVRSTETEVSKPGARWGCTHPLFWHELLSGQAPCVVALCHISLLSKAATFGAQCFSPASVCDSSLGRGMVLWVAGSEPSVVQSL